jgi:acyl-CoA reductase-like NAD-dependent aldehyde dehydrogenase
MTGGEQAARGRTGEPATGVVVSIVDGRARPTAAVPRTIRAWDGAPVGEVADAVLDDVTAAVASATAGLAHPFPPADRARVLRAFAARIAAAADDYAELLMAECAKPLAEARGEVQRSIAVLEECAEEATRVVGHLVPVQGVSGSEDRISFTLRIPVGVVAAITPFNGALLSPAHKVGAALAAGAACILKPADATPLSAARFVQDALAAGVPADRVALIVSEGPDVPSALVRDPGVAMVSFTGSTAVGLRIRQDLGLRPAILELGGNAPLIVHSDGDVAAAAAASVPGAFGYAGQVCISVQRIFVHESRYAEFRAAFLERVERLVVGSPADPATEVGPLLSEQRAAALEASVRQAVASGATALTPIRREGALMWPIVLEGAEPTAPVVCEEAFGPLVSLFSYRDVGDAFALANATEYGLQAGLFTSDYTVIHDAMQQLDFGGVIVNDTSRYRVDRMPYGGTKASGSGKEGVRYSIEQMTKERLVVLRPAAR